VVAIPEFIFEADAVFLFVLVGISAGQGVSIGSGWLHIPGSHGFASFWRGFWFLIFWSLIIALVVDLVTPIVLPVMQDYPGYVPSANLLALAVASVSFGVQAEMPYKARWPAVTFLLLGVACAVLAYLGII
jgi:hypothetical protein